jgi:hypothetical protein
MTSETVVEAPRPRSSLLGVLAFVLAVIAYLVMPALILGAREPGGVVAFAGESAVIAVPALVFGSLAVVAVVAAVTRRGRGWAIAALVVALANSYSPVHRVIAELTQAIFG